MGTGRATGGTPSCCGAVTPGPRGDFLRAQAWLKPLDAAPKGATCFAGWASFHVHAREQYCDIPSVQVAGGASIGALHLALPRVAGCEVDGGDAWALRAEAYGSRAEGPGGGRAKPTSASASDGPVLVLDGAPYSVDWSQMRGAVTGTLGGLEPPLPGRGGGVSARGRGGEGLLAGGARQAGSEEHPAKVLVRLQPSMRLLSFRMCVSISSTEGRERLSGKLRQIIWNLFFVKRSRARSECLECPSRRT